MKSTRNYGIEIEMGFPNESDIYDSRNDIPSSWNLTRDGSLTCENPIELVSPILNGPIGIRKLRRVCETLIDAGANTSHESCGLHVHMDGKEFKDTVTIKAVKAKEYKRSAGAEMVAYIPNSVLGYYTGGSSLKLEKNVGLTADVFSWVTQRNVPADRIYINRGFRGNIDLITYSVDGVLRMAEIDDDLYRKITTGHDKAMQALEKSGQDISAEFFEVELAKKVISQLVEKEDGYYLEKTRKVNNFLGLKTLFYFYTLFGDIHQNMVQDNRKFGNMYCISLSDSFDPVDIRGLNDINALERYWYKVDDDATVTSLKREKYQDSRYHDVNLHSLWGRHGTVEIRSHSSTLDWRKIGLWTEFHQHIVDMCASNELTCQDMMGAESITDLREKTQFMLDVLKLPVHLDKYVKRLVNYFAILKNPL